MRRCARCIMPETAKSITFDENGLCQLCRAYKGPDIRGESQLRQEIEPFQKNAEKYNCIVPVSGGRDSSYALYYAKEVLGLKPLAVHNDNDFETEIARQNLEKITRSLDVPLIRISSREQLARKIVVEKFKMNARFGAWRIVEQTCEACQYGFESASYNTAREKGVKLIIWGDSNEESTTPYHLLAKHIPPTRLARLLSPGVFNILKYKYYFSKMKREYGPDSSEGLKEIHLYDYIEWSRNTIVDTIQNKMGWSKPDASATSWRIDCSLVPLVNYLTEKAYGVSKIELGFSQMIRSGKMTRDEALKQAEEITKSVNSADIKEFLEDLGISLSCINKIL